MTRTTPTTQRGRRTDKHACVSPPPPGRKRAPQAAAARRGPPSVCSTETSRQPPQKKRKQADAAVGHSSGAANDEPTEAAVKDVKAKLDSIVSAFTAGNYDDTKGRSCAALKREPY
eukprot:1672836-Lingulodinium_polyedra.AAC.1